MLDELHSLHSLRNCDTPDDLRRDVSRRLRSLGFERWMLSGLATSQRANSMLGNFPTEWLDYYDRLGYFEIDPLVQHCRQNVSPCAWHAGPSATASSARVRYFREAAEYGLRGGAAVPIHAPGSQSFMLMVATESSHDALDVRDLGELLLLAMLVHESSQRMSQSTAQEPVHLTLRELDTLRWAAEGKTSWEIGQLVGIGERTVIFHLNNAAKKLGVIGRRQAVTRAIALQLIAL